MAADEDVSGDNGMGERGCHLTAVVHELHRDIDSVLGHGDETDILERTAKLLRLGIALPLLKEGAERLAIDDRRVTMAANNDLTVALDGNGGETAALAIPAVERREGVNGDALLSGGA